MAIFEDECYADLIWDDGAPAAIYSMDPDQVIHVGSFSKTCRRPCGSAMSSPIGRSWAGLSALKRETDSGTGALEQMVVAEYFSQDFAEHVGELTGVLKEKLDTMVEAVEREFGTAVEKMWYPKGGIFLWMKLPDQVDVTKLVAPAAKGGSPSTPAPNGRANRDEPNRTCGFASPCRRRTRSEAASPHWRGSATRKPAFPSEAPTCNASSNPAEGVARGYKAH